MFGAYADDTRERLGDERLAWLAELPAEYRLGELSIVHAAPGDLWRAPMPGADDTELRDTYRPLDAARVVYGHIHRPFLRDLNELIVANSGSVGMPWDGDPRAAYVILDNGKPSVVRVAYDIEAEVRALRDNRHPGATAWPKCDAADVSSRRDDRVCGAQARAWTLGPSACSAGSHRLRSVAGGRWVSLTLQHPEKSPKMRLASRRLELAGNTAMLNGL